MIYYKYTNEDGTPCNGGSGKYNLPKGSKPGACMPMVKNIVACERGYHLMRQVDLLEWSGRTLWVAEGRGEHVRYDNKDVFGQARLIRKVETWNQITQTLLACDCAERVLPIYEKKYPNDKRPREAIEAGRNYARGKIGDAAWDAARAAAGDAARTAAWAAAWAAARAAAWDAARAAAWDAARAAAGDAAWDAARAAAGDAARTAAWAAAGDAARTAEKKWQIKRFMWYLKKQR